MEKEEFKQFIDERIDQRLKARLRGIVKQYAENFLRCGGQQIGKTERPDHFDLATERTTALHRMAEEFCAVLRRADLTFDWRFLEADFDLFLAFQWVAVSCEQSINEKIYEVCNVDLAKARKGIEFLLDSEVEQFRNKKQVYECDGADIENWYYSLLGVSFGRWEPELVVVGVRLNRQIESQFSPTALSDLIQKVGGAERFKELGKNLDPGKLWGQFVSGELKKAKRLDRDYAKWTKPAQGRLGDILVTPTIPWEAYQIQVHEHFDLEPLDVPSRLPKNWDESFARMDYLVSYTDRTRVGPPAPYIEYWIRRFVTLAICLRSSATMMHQVRNSSSINNEYIDLLGPTQYSAIAIPEARDADSRFPFEFGKEPLFRSVHEFSLPHAPFTSAADFDQLDNLGFSQAWEWLRNASTDASRKAQTALELFETSSVLGREIGPSTADLAAAWQTVSLVSVLEMICVNQSRNARRNWKNSSGRAPTKREQIRPKVEELLARRGEGRSYIRESANRINNAYDIRNSFLHAGSLVAKGNLITAGVVEELEEVVRRVLSEYIRQHSDGYECTNND